MFIHSIKNGIYSFYRKNILVYLLFGGHRPVSSQRSNFQLNVQQGSSLISDEYDKDRKHTSAKSYSLSTYPIPFSSEITFDFKLPEESQVQLSIYNNLGHLVFGKIEELTKGYQSITLNQLEDLPSELYWYSFDTGNDILFGKISKN